LLGTYTLSLLRKFVTYDRKKFYKIDTRTTEQQQQQRRRRRDFRVDATADSAKIVVVAAMYDASPAAADPPAGPASGSGDRRDQFRCQVAVGGDGGRSGRGVDVIKRVFSLSRPCDFSSNGILTTGILTNGILTTGILTTGIVTNGIVTNGILTTLINTLNRVVGIRHGTLHMDTQLDSKKMRRSA
jgi:hypothetical protein